MLSKLRGAPRSLPVSPGMLVGAAALLLALTLTLVLAVLLPTLRRVDRALSIIEQALPAVTEMRPEVDRIDRNVELVTPEITAMRDPLSRLEGRMGRLSDPVEQMAASLEDLRLSIAVLPELRRELVRTNRSLGQVQGDFAHTRDTLAAMLAQLATLTRDFEQAIVLMDKMAQHVENIDRKTLFPAQTGSR